MSETASLSGRNQPTGCQRWCYENRQHRPQERSLISGFLQMVIGGIHLGWNLYNPHFTRELWAEEANLAEKICVIGSWFVGSIVGGLNAGFFIDSLGRKRMMRIGVITQIVGSLIQIFFSRMVIGMLIGRIMVGYSFGGSYLTLLAYNGEISSKKNRGVITSFTHIGIMFGFLVFTILKASVAPSEYIDIVFVMSIVTGVLAIIALPINHFFMYESPVVLCLNQLDNEALEVMTQLRNEKTPSIDTRDEFQDMSDMVYHDIRKIGSVYKLSSFYFMIILRLLITMLNNYPLNFIKINAAIDAFSSLGGHDFQPVYLCLLRLGFSIGSAFGIDIIGRKCIILWSVRLSVVAMIIIGAVMASKTISTIAFFMIFEAISSFGTAIVVDVYSTEAFATKQKGMALSLVHFAENIFQMTLILIGFLVGIDDTFGYISIFVFASIAFVISFIRMPETKKITLRQVRDKFSLTVGCEMY